MSPNLGFDRFGGHLVQTLPQTELKKEIQNILEKDAPAYVLYEYQYHFGVFLVFLVLVFFARSTESGPGLV